MMMTPSLLFACSWLAGNGVNKTEDILEWIRDRNGSVSVAVHKTTLGSSGWLYNDATGYIENGMRSFFQITGFRSYSFETGTVQEQPVIIQDEIGYLGILCKEIDGVLHFLMQAKIEPGNINKIQISPTIQATKSNFLQMHGGAKPGYLEYFLDTKQHIIIVDQIQSEQSSRFVKKRNRNIMLLVDKNMPIQETQSHKWMTLGQIKALMRIDNLVNMDTRSVLSCIPFYDYIDGVESVYSDSNDRALAASIISGAQHGVLPRVYRHINDYKMFRMAKTEFVPLYSLKGWAMNHQGGRDEFSCKSGWPFKIIFCDISIDGREVRHWGQPLLEAEGMAWFGMFTCVASGIREFLVKAKPEIGCFDRIELGPAVQLESTEIGSPGTVVDELFFEKYGRREGVLYDAILSEEGGRFYHEQNHNVIIEIDKHMLPLLPEGYFWLTYQTVCRLIQINNCVNIQLRNLIALLEL